MRAVLLSVLLLAGCNYMERKDVGEAPIEETVTFTEIRTEVLEPFCLGCHDGQGPLADLTSHRALLEGGWVVPGLPDSSPLFLSVMAGRMPKGGPVLDPNLIRKMEKWILDGASGEDTVPPPVVPPEEKTGFEAILADILRPRCAGCHSGASPKGEFDVTDYATVAAYVEPGDPDASYLFEVVETGYMPPGPRDLTPEQVERIRKWIAEGAKAT